jgi:tRNA-2-methylthio-N6-dimethylallyladenosine synthase
MNTVPRELAQERFDRLAPLVRDLSYAANLRELGTTREILIEGASKRDASTLSGRTPHNRLVHLPLPADTDARALAGHFLNVRITGAHPWFLTGEILPDTV